MAHKTRVRYVNASTDRNKAGALLNVYEVLYVHLPSPDEALSVVINAARVGQALQFCVFTLSHSVFSVKTREKRASWLIGF